MPGDVGRHLLHLHVKLVIGVVASSGAMQEPKTTCEASGYAAMGNPGVSWTLAGVGAASSSALPDGQYSSDLRAHEKCGKIAKVHFLRFLGVERKNFMWNLGTNSAFIAIHRLFLL